MEEKIIEYVKSLFANYGWWALALVGATFLVMIPVNALIKVVFKNAKSTEASRIRKTLSALFVYLVAMGVVAVANLILHIDTNIEFLFISCVPVGSVAMVVWAAFKFTRDLGFGWLIKMLEKSGKIKEILKGLPLDNKIAFKIYNNLIEQIEKAKGENSQIVESKQVELTAMASSMLNGFVEAEKVSSTAAGIVDALKLKFIKK